MYFWATHKEFKGLFERNSCIHLIDWKISMPFPSKKIYIILYIIIKIKRRKS